MNIFGVMHSQESASCGPDGAGCQCSAPGSDPCWELSVQIGEGAAGGGVVVTASPANLMFSIHAPGTAYQQPAQETKATLGMRGCTLASWLSAMFIASLCSNQAGGEPGHKENSVRGREWELPSLVRNLWPPRVDVDQLRILSIPRLDTPRRSQQLNVGRRRLHVSEWQCGAAPTTRSVLVCTP
jgi:hypothetical protein